MKFTRLKITIITLATALLIPLSCKKSFLSQTNTFGATQGATFTTSASIIALVNAIYDSYQNSNLLKKSLWYYADYLPHDWFNNGSDIAWNNYTYSGTFDALPDFWDNLYIGIARVNIALPIIKTAIAQGIVTPALGNRLTGEALFLRGTMYYYLTGTFGGVPLELNPSNNGLQPRNTQLQCFQQVVADMQAAEGLLVSKTALATADLGRATTGAAYAYEGSAQMWLAESDPSNAAAHYTAALKAFNNPEFASYSLVMPYLNESEYNNQNNSESIFEIQFDLTGGNQSWGDSWQPPGGELGWIDSFSWPSEITGEGYDYGSPALYYSYQTGDTRKLATIIGPGDADESPGIIGEWGGIQGYPNVVGNQASANTPLSSVTTALDPMNHKADSTNIIQNRIRYTDGTGSAYADQNTSKPINTNGTLANPWYGTDGTPRSGYCCEKKWRDPTLTGGSGPGRLFGSQNQVLLRYAEVLLSKAECEIRLGQTTQGLADLNKVRSRAFNGNTPTVFQDGYLPQADANGNPIPAPVITDPLQMVFSEYRHELTGEYSLMYLLRRAGIDASTGVAYDRELLHLWNTGPASQYPYGSRPNTYVIYPYGPTHNTPAAIMADLSGNQGVTYNDLPPGKDILPLPVSQIALNPNLKQNPGY
jgi:hypothetical protein